MEQYEAHIAKVKATIPAEQLLVFNVKDGWAPLCNFLGKPVPEFPFPSVNDSSSLEATKRVIMVAVYAWIPCLLLLAYLVARCCCGCGVGQTDKQKRG